MRDPHVVSLSYRLVSAETVTFTKRAAPVQAQLDGFKVRLGDGSLVVEMLAHYASEDSARAAVEPYLRAWEIWHALRVGGQPEFRFEFVRAGVVDRDPPPGASQTVERSSLLHSRATGSATVSVERDSLPAPPSAFILNADVETVWARWRAYREGREPLPSMAYFALTVLEMPERAYRARRVRRAAATRLGIEEAVLSKLGKLVSERGDVTMARKAEAAARPLAAEEVAWLDAAVLAIIRRVGEVGAAGSAASLPQLTMADLPTL